MLPRTKTKMSEESRIPLELPRPDLQSSRLRLRPLTLGDEEQVQELIAAIEIASTTLSIPHPLPPGGTLAWLSKKLDGYEKGEDLVLALEYQGQVIGTSGLFLNRRDDLAELGYWIGKPYWGRGFASEAAKAMISFGFENLGLHRIQARSFARNPASARVLEKVGMHFEGLLRGYVKKWGIYEDVLSYAVLAPEWPRD